MIILTFFIDTCAAAEEEEELKKSAVVNWYLKEIESEIDSEEELVNKKGLIEKVLHRLVHYVSPQSKKKNNLQLISNQQISISKPSLDLTDGVYLFPQDHILIELSQAGLKGSESESTDKEVVLVVNPNYILDD